MARGLTRAEFAERADITVQYASRVEGEENLGLETLVKIANALEVPMAALFERPTVAPVERKRGRPPKVASGSDAVGDAPTKRARRPHVTTRRT